MRYRLDEYVPPDGCYHIARVEYRSGRSCRLHTHDFAELFVIEDGRGLHQINGRNEVVERGDVVLIRPDDRHGFTVRRGAGFTMVNLAFATDVVDHIRDRYFQADPAWIGAGDAMPASWRVDDPALQRIGELSGQLSMQRQRRLDLESFLLNVLQWVTADRGADDLPQPQWLREAILAYTHDDLAGGVNRFVQLTGKSTEHVNRTVRQCLGQTTTELVNALRLDRAAHLLRMTTRPIVDVAMDSGFDNLSYFYRRFNDRFGTTPRRYRHTAHAVAR